jgi:broad specificity phosphatase PhoE
LYIIRHGQSTNNALGIDQAQRVFDPPLTDTGHAQARAVAKYLAEGLNYEALVAISHTPEGRAAAAEGLGSRANGSALHPSFTLTHLYTSAMHRALQTAAPIAEATGAAPEIWIDIHEHGGIYLEEGGVIKGFGGRTRGQIMEEFPLYVLPELITDAGWWDTKAGMEDISLCRARAMRVARSLRERATHEATAEDRVALVTHGTFIDSLLKAFYSLLPGETFFHWHYNTAITRVDILRDGRIIVRYINRIHHLPPELITT